MTSATQTATAGLFAHEPGAPRSAPSAWLGLCAALLLCAATPGVAQELEPRRWSHLPTGMNFAGLGYAYTRADISDSPAFRLDDVEAHVSTWAAKYIRTFELFDKSARIDVTQGYQEGKWEGLLDGKPASTTRSGWTDTTVRFAVNLIGAPPLSGREYAAYRASARDETIVGAGLAVDLPTGEYMSERLINLGSNRFTFRPQLGVVRNLDNWSMEATASAWIYTDNDEFFGGNTVEQDPLYALQGHLTYTFRPGFWAGVSAGYGYGGQTTVNGLEKNDKRRTVAWAVSGGVPITRDWGVKVIYIGTQRKSTVGNNTDSLVVSLSHFW